MATEVIDDTGPLQAVAIVEMSDAKRPYIVDAQAEAVIEFDSVQETRAQQKVSEDTGLHLPHRPERSRHHPAMSFREVLRRSLSGGSHSSSYTDLAAEELEPDLAMIGGLITPTRMHVCVSLGCALFMSLCVCVCVHVMCVCPLVGSKILTFATAPQLQPQTRC